MLKPAELEAVRDQCASVRFITPQTSFGAEIRSARARLEGITISGIWPDWHEIESRSVVLGRPFTAIDEEQARQVCLVNDAAIRELQLDADPVGDILLIEARKPKVP